MATGSTDGGRQTQDSSPEWQLDPRTGDDKHRIPLPNGNWIHGRGTTNTGFLSRMATGSTDGGRQTQDSSPEWQLDPRAGDDKHRIPRPNGNWIHGRGTTNTG